MSTRRVDADGGAIAAIAAAIERAPLVAFDLEFLSQDRLIPALCLVQIAWPARGEDVGLDAAGGAIVAADSHVEVRLLDPLAVDVSPVIHALAAHPCPVAHAPRQDLAILVARFGVAIPRVVDTQLMAAFAGIGDQIGLGTLAHELVGVRIGKELQWTDWAQRPLSDAQLAYAESDVRHLPAIYGMLAHRLGERLAWARAESAAVVADAVAAAGVTPETAWRQVGGLRGLDGEALAAVVSLAAWRQRTCIALDRPLGQLLNDKLLVELARHRPRTAAAIRGVKGMSGLARQRAEEISEAIAAATPGAVAAIPAGRSPSVRAQRWAEMLLAIVQLVAEQTGIAARLLATRSDAEELARAVDEHGIAAIDRLPAMASWRREVLGQAWRDWLTGARVLAGDLTAPHGLRLV